jgi:hypothetical protein
MLDVAFLNNTVATAQFSLFAVTVELDAPGNIDCRTVSALRREEE